MEGGGKWQRNYAGAGYRVSEGGGNLITILLPELLLDIRTLPSPFFLFPSPCIMQLKIVGWRDGEGGQETKVPPPLLFLSLSIPPLRRDGDGGGDGME